MTSTEFKLAEFYPYRLAILSDAISQAFVPIYQKEFNLSRNEWRVLAAVAEHQDMSAKQIAAYSTLEKMQVSRALTSLLQRNFVCYTGTEQDKREKRVTLSCEGWQTFNQLIPMIQTKQMQLLAQFSEQELAVLSDMMTRLLSASKQSE